MVFGASTFLPKLRCFPLFTSARSDTSRSLRDHAQIAVQIAVVEDVAFAQQRVVILQDARRADHVLRLALDLQVVVEQMGLDAQPGFDQPDVFIASAKEAFNASADTDTGFHQVGVGYLL